MSSAPQRVDLDAVAPLAPEGLLMIATGARHLQEALEAAAHCRPWLGGRPLLLITDEPTAELEGFDYVASHPCPVGSYRDKIAPLGVLPFERCLFLDTDACLIADVDDLFALLEVFDVAACHAPVRFHQWCDRTVPEGFCEVNSGVLGLRRGAATAALIAQWLTLYDRVGLSVDQATLRAALWPALQQGLRLYILPPEYNLRTTKPWLAGRGLAVKVLHGRLPAARRQRLIAYLNADPDRFRSSAALASGANEWVRGDRSMSRWLSWLRRRLP